MGILSPALDRLKQIDKVRQPGGIKLTENELDELVFYLEQHGRIASAQISGTPQ